MCVRAVLDTNILVSACCKPDGLEAQTVAQAIRGAFTACASGQVVAEYREVLSRDKFASLRGRATQLLTALEPKLLMVEAAGEIRASRDADDNCFIACAASSGADYLVTGNLRHFPPCWGRTRAVNARQFLAELAERRGTRTSQLS
jgi:putative PIN family toxin of toxin-antitoxin system